MRPRMRLVLATLAFCAGVPSTANAWTEANVQSVSAHVSVDSAGRATVALVLTVRIGGGWLEGLDIDGLDPDLILSTEEPPWAISVDDPDLEWSPRARVREGGRIRLAFVDRRSPRRGILRVGLTYSTDLASRGTRPLADEQVRISWTLPGWRTGLDGVEVELSTPRGAVAASTMEDGVDAADEHRTSERDGITTHAFRRIHLPRTVPWTVSVDLPAEAMDAALRGPSVATQREAPGAPATNDAGPSPLILVAALFFAAIFARASFAARCRAVGATVRPLIPGPLWLLVPAAAGLVALGIRYATREPVLALAAIVAISALAIQRTPRRSTTASIAFEPCPPIARSRARRRHRNAHLAGSPLLDLSTALGAVCFVAALGAAVVLGDLATRPSAVALASIGLLAIPFVTATRFHLPATPDGQLLALTRLAGAVKDLGPVALSLVLGRDQASTVVEARLRLTPAAAAAGLVRLDVLLLERPVLGGFESTPALLVVTHDQSDAETRIEALGLSAPIDGPDEQRARLIVRGRDIDVAIRDVVRSLVAEEPEQERALLTAA